MEVVNANLDRIRTPGPQDKVYKDECFYSFDCPESPTGVYVCMNRWLGVGDKYLDRYSKRTDNKVFLHIKRTKKVVEEKEAVPEKVSRLAINIEGGFKGEQEFEWEEQCSIVTLPDRVRLDINDLKVPMGVSLSVAGIRTSVSATRQALVNAVVGSWDGEALFVSKHAENLKQLENPPRIPPSGWKCQAEGCNLDNNLWLNLTDGSILCGRQFFDGTGGNNHAVDHFKAAGQGGGPLAVKLGTITRDGKADVFSYEDDDMVLNPKLEQHMAHFGIQIASCEKTDKSMAELEIDINERIGEWATLTESGSKLEPVSGPGRTGLHNLGNTCYMNSMMQVLFTLPDWLAFYSREKWLDNGSLSDPASDLPLQLSKLCKGLVSGEYSAKGDEADLRENGSQPGIKPTMFKQLIGRGHVEFSSNRQQDAQEFLMHILNQVEKAHLKNGDSGNLASCMRFEVEDRIECTITGQVAYKKRKEEWLPLAIPMQAALNTTEVAEYQKKKEEAEAKKEQKPELVRAKIPFEKVLEVHEGATEVEEWFSPAAKVKTTAKKTMRMATFPDYLFIQMQKFGTDANWQPIKLDCEVDMPEVLDLSSLKATGLQPGEVEMVEESASGNLPAIIEIDEAVVSQLVDMGFGREASKRAVHSTGNTGAETAMAWVMEHMEDTDFNSPFNQTGAGPAKVCSAGEEVVVMVMSMGFSREQAEMGLRNTENSVERAVDWIFSHPDGEGDTPAAAAAHKEGSVGDQQQCRNGEPRYELSAFVSHMGPSNHSGHYVAHIKDSSDPSRWLIFNDNKVAVSVTPPKELGYLYLYKRL